MEAAQTRRTLLDVDPRRNSEDATVRATWQREYDDAVATETVAMGNAGVGRNPPVNQGVAAAVAPAGGAARGGQNATALHAMCRPPTMEELRELELGPSSAAVASPTDLEAIALQWEEDGVPAGVVARVAFNVANKCFDDGSSASYQAKGEEPVSRKPYDRLIAIVRRVCTLRQFCRYYAPLIWNVRVKANEPPTSWARMGLKREHAFAACDFMDGVDNKASMRQLIIRSPTDAELQAFKAREALALEDAARARGVAANNDMRVTKGGIGFVPQRMSNVPAPQD
nr:MAG: coat protein [Physalis virus X]